MVVPSFDVGNVRNFVSRLQLMFCRSRSIPIGFGCPGELVGPGQYTLQLFRITVLACDKVQLMSALFDADKSVCSLLSVSITCIVISHPKQNPKAVCPFRCVLHAYCNIFKDIIGWTHFPKEFLVNYLVIFQFFQNQFGMFLVIFSIFPK